MPRGGHDIPMSGTHLKGTHEVVTKGVDPTIKGAFFCKGPTPWPTPARGGPTHRL